LRAGHAVTAWNRTQRAVPAELDAVVHADSIAAVIRGRPTVSYASPDRTLSVLCSTRRCLTNSAPASW
jgi:hypothetical protein